MRNLYFTRKGAERIAQQKKELIDRLVETRKQKGEAASVGGNVWHDNFSFEQLTRDENDLNSQISRISESMRRMTVIEHVSSDLSKLRIGHIAVLDVDGEEQIYQVGGFEDSDPNSEPPTISYLAPLIHDLIGAEVGASSDVEIDGKYKRVVLMTIQGPPSQAKGGT